MQSTTKAAADWTATLTAYTLAKAEEDAFDERHFGHINLLPVGAELNRAIDAVPRELWTACEALQDTRCDAEDALIATPAPTLSEAIYKIELARVRWADFVDWPDDWWMAVMADLHRLAGRAGQ